MQTAITHRPLLVLATALAFALAGCAAPPSPGGASRSVAPQPDTAPRALFAGPEMDYQPGVLRARDGRLFLVVERLDTTALSGDLLLSVSDDGGRRWTTPVRIVATEASERHPALVQHRDGSFSLFHMAGTPAAGYRIHRATSPDGQTWTLRGALDLGWDAPGEINPAVIAERDGSLTMTYHRLRGPAYLARSLDGGATWDRRRTTVSNGRSAALPRIARREQDGTYLLTYQQAREGQRLDLWARTTRDPYVWRDTAVAVAAGSNSHDSRPAVLADGRFFVPYVDAGAGEVFNLFYRTTRDGRSWSAPTRLSADTARMDVEPYPIPHPTRSLVTLFWARQAGPHTPRDYDLWLRPELVVP